MLHTYFCILPMRLTLVTEKAGKLSYMHFARHLICKSGVVEMGCTH